MSGAAGPHVEDLACIRSRRRAAELAPAFHQLAPLHDDIAPAIGVLDRAADLVSEAQFDDEAREVRLLLGPSLEA